VPTNTITGLIILLAFALFSNIPLGYLRETTRRYSLNWFVCIHLSIPFIIALRYTLNFGWEIVPYSIAAAIIGQVIGSRYRRHKLQ